MNLNFETTVRLLELMEDLSEGIQKVPSKYKDSQMPLKKKQEGWFSCPIKVLEDRLQIKATTLNSSINYLIKQGYLKKERGGRSGNHWLVQL